MPDASPSVIPFYKTTAVGGEEAALAEVLASGQLVGGGKKTGLAQAELERITGAGKVLLTNSGTAALELACLLLDLRLGDEVIVPSFTFSSCANAIAMRGAVPVFVDILPENLNVDPASIEAAITPKTRAIMPVHYAGTAADMDAIDAIAKANGLGVIEDAAQAIGSYLLGRHLGSIGRLGALSFHGSKNLSSGEGGALLINDPHLYQKAEILWEKGTDRSRFMRGEVDKYTWQELGSSFLPSELTAALLLQQLRQVEGITARRVAAWQRYHSGLAQLEEQGALRRPTIPADNCHNGHIYWTILPDARKRDLVLSRLRERGVAATFHFVPLHSAPAGKKLGRSVGKLPVTEDLSARLLRLPIYDSIEPAEQDHVLATLTDVMRDLRSG